jgi:hypothetical protein
VPGKLKKAFFRMTHRLGITRPPLFCSFCFDNALARLNAVRVSICTQCIRDAKALVGLRAAPDHLWLAASDEGACDLCFGTVSPGARNVHGRAAVICVPCVELAVEVIDEEDAAKARKRPKG